MRQRSCEVCQRLDWKTVRDIYHVMRNREKACLYMLSLVHWLMYAASEGVNDMNSLAGWYDHGDVALGSIVELLGPSLRLYGAGCAGRTVE